MTKFELDKNVEKNSNPSFLNFLFKLIFHNFDTPFVNFWHECESYIFRMSSEANAVWSECLRVIEQHVNEQSYSTWFKPILPVKLEGSTLTIQVPSQFFYEYIEEHYINLLAKTLKRELGKEARLEYRIMVDSGNGKAKPLTMDVSGQSFKSYSKMLLIRPGTPSP